MTATARHRIVARAALLLGLLAVVAGGGVAFRRVTAHPSAPAATTTLRIWYGTDDPTERSWAQALVQRFESAHSSIRVSLTTYALDDLNTKMQLALGAGNPPDLVYTTPRSPGLPVYARAGQLLNLTSFARSHRWSERLRSGLLTEYNNLLSPTGSSRYVYAVPYHMAAVAVLYNKAIFRKLKLGIPRTVNDLEQIAKSARKAGYVGFGLGNADGWVGDDWWSSLVNAYAGPSALEPVLRISPRFSYQGQAFRWGAATLQRWANSGYFTEDFGGADAQESVDGFFQGLTALQLVSSTQNSQILADARRTKLEVGVFPFPSVSASRRPVMAVSGYEGWAIPRASKQPAAALEFIDQAVLTEPTARLLLDNGLVPAYPLSGRSVRPAAPFQGDYFDALTRAEPGVYLDGAPVPNLNATIEANIQLLLQGAETPDFLVRSVQGVYASGGAKATHTRTDGEF
jgi:raffinose/stachyose/melibiose transport system substrate-binding protein